MAKYNLILSLDIEAPSAREAAIKARSILKGETYEPCFSVEDTASGEECTIDFSTLAVPATEEQRADFLQGYITALKWSTSGDFEGEELDNLEDFELCSSTYNLCADDCAQFIKFNMLDLNLYTAAMDTGDNLAGAWDIAGHDFWLTRAGHGAGYWDRGLEELGARLTAAAKAYGNVDPYIADDGQIYIDFTG